MAKFNLSKLVLLLLLNSCGPDAPCYLGICGYDFSRSDIEDVEAAIPLADLGLTLVLEHPVTVQLGVVLPEALGVTTWYKTVWGDRVQGFDIEIEETLERCDRCVVLIHELLHVYLISNQDDYGHPNGWFSESSYGARNTEFLGTTELYRNGGCGCRP